MVKVYKHLFILVGSTLRQIWRMDALTNFYQSFRLLSILYSCYCLEFSLRGIVYLTYWSKQDLYNRINNLLCSVKNANPYGNLATFQCYTGTIILLWDVISCELMQFHNQWNFWCSNNLFFGRSQFDAYMSPYHAIIQPFTQGHFMTASLQININLKIHYHNRIHLS
jgi:hypothetical protein